MANKLLTLCGRSPLLSRLLNHLGVKPKDNVDDEGHEVVHKPFDYDQSKQVRHYCLASFSLWLCFTCFVFWYSTTVDRKSLPNTSHRASNLAKAVNGISGDGGTTAFTSLTVIPVCSTSVEIAAQVKSYLSRAFPIAVTATGAFEIEGEENCKNSTAATVSNARLWFQSRMKFSPNNFDDSFALYVYLSTSTDQPDAADNSAAAVYPSIDVSEQLSSLLAFPRKYNNYVSRNDQNQFQQKESFDGVMSNVVEVLAGTWFFKPFATQQVDLSKHKSPPSTLPQQSENSIRTFSSAVLSSGYIFNFLLIGDGLKRIFWDFHSDVYQKFFTGLLGRLRLLFDVRIESQVVHHGNLESLSATSARIKTDKMGARNITLMPADLSRFLSVSGKWLAEDVLIFPTHMPPPILNFALHAPGLHNFKVKDKEGVLGRSFSLPSWGSLVFPEATAKQADDTEDQQTMCSPSQLEISDAVGHWTAFVRFSLGLPHSNIIDHLTPFANSLRNPQRSQMLSEAFCDNYEHLKLKHLDVWLEVPRQHGVALWEITALARQYAVHYLLRGSYNIVSLIDLIRNLPDLVVEERTGQTASRSLTFLEKALDAIKRGVLSDAIGLARSGFQESVEALHDESTMAKTFFAADMKQALFLPFFFPFAIGIILNLIKEFKYWWEWKTEVKKRSVKSY